MGQCSDLTGCATCRGLPCEAGGCVAGSPKVATEQVQTMHQSVDRSSLGVLIHAHAPQARAAFLRVGKKPRLVAQVFRPYPAQLRRVLHGVLRKAPLQLLKADRVTMQRVRFTLTFKSAVLPAKFLVVTARI